MRTWLKKIFSVDTYKASTQGIMALPLSWSPLHHGSELGMTKISSLHSNASSTTFVCASGSCTHVYKKWSIHHSTSTFAINYQSNKTVQFCKYLRNSVLQISPQPNYTKISLSLNPLFNLGLSVLVWVRISSCTKVLDKAQNNDELQLPFPVCGTLTNSSPPKQVGSVTSGSTYFFALGLLPSRWCINICLHSAGNPLQVPSCLMKIFPVFLKCNRTSLALIVHQSLEALFQSRKTFPDHGREVGKKEQLLINL